MKPVEDKYSFDVYMTNDGCTDGTPESVKQLYPHVNVIDGEGGLYWSGGMRKAWVNAAKIRSMITICGLMMMLTFIMMLC